jgi:uncharacterized membrane protein YhaH (DUF805 family)
MQKLFSFEGRLRRRDYWLIVLGIWVLEIILIKILALTMLGGAAALSVSTDSAANAAAAMTAMGPMFQIYGLVGLIFLWPALAIGVKRCHDRNKSGWFLLIGLIPILGGLWLLIELGFLDGTPGPNRFGPSPKGLGGPVEPAAAVA